MERAMLTVEDLMTTNVMTLSAKDTIGHADADMKLGDVRHIPIVDEKAHLVGIVSNRDVFRALGRSNRGKVIPVWEIMKRDVFTVRPETPAHAAVELMLEKKIGALPVIGDGEQLVGIVTETDFLAIAHEALLRSGKESRTAGGGSSAPSGNR
jgi:CBS domain-containing protein